MLYIFAVRTFGYHGLEVSTLSLKPKVEIPGSVAQRSSDMRLSAKCYFIADLAQQIRKQLLLRCDAAIVVIDHAVAMRVKSGQQRSTTGRTERIRNEGIAKAHPLSGNAVHVGRSQDAVSRATHGVPSLIVRHHDDKVRPVRGSRPSRDGRQ
jgi:hypothetical protein